MTNLDRHKYAGGNHRHMAGWRKQHVDLRDVFLDAVVTNPSAFDLRSTGALMPPVRDQGQIGSCTSNGGCEAAGYAYSKLTKSPDPMFSRLDLYASTRETEGSPLNEDSGCQVRDVFKTMKASGVCLETTWPYDVSKFSVAPPRKAVIEALQHKAISYVSCPTLDAIKTSLARDKYPLIGGFTCYSSMFAPSVDTTGDVPIPQKHEKVEGGHCVLWIGYDDVKKHVIFQNSWSDTWGAKGYGTLPYIFFENGMASDHWSLRTETV